MPAFRRVKDVDAGPGALGLLTPPGRRTVFIVRPRALPWDLVAAAEPSPTGLPFRDFDRAEAAAAGAGLFRALEEWAAGGLGRVEVLDAATGGGYLVRVQVGALTLVACLRQPGQPYRPLLFGRRDEADQAAAAVKACLCPAAGAGQEVYFNTRNFSR